MSARYRADQFSMSSAASSNRPMVMIGAGRMGQRRVGTNWDRSSSAVRPEPTGRSAFPNYSRALAELAEAEERIAAMQLNHEAQDEALQRWYDRTHPTTGIDHVYRSVEILNHDSDQAFEAAVAYRRAAMAAHRVGDTVLAAEFEIHASHFESDFSAAEQGLVDLERSTGSV